MRASDVDTSREAVGRLVALAAEVSADYKQNADCCGQRDCGGVCAAPACMFGTMLRVLQDGSDTLRALLARAEAAEAVAESRGASLARLEADLSAAYRAGAEAMRERAEAHLRTGAARLERWGYEAKAHKAREWAAAIRALPLPAPEARRDD